MLSKELSSGRRWNLEGILPPSGLLNLLVEMVDEIPGKRPTSTQVIDRMKGMIEEQPKGWRSSHAWSEHEWKCCNQPPESYRVAEEDEIHDAFLFDN